MASVTLRDVHDFELRLLEPCLAMTERGIRVNEARRQAMLADLQAMKAPLAASIEEQVVSGILLARLDGKLSKLPKPHLFTKKWVCPCCHGGSAARLHCFRCAGLDHSPGEARSRTLARCQVCNGDGKRQLLTFNPGSPEQVKIVLYDVLRLPVRTKGGKRSSDETALKDLLSVADDDARTLIHNLLKLTKVDTMQEICKRIEPAPDGRIRTVYNPAGTETGRFSSSESFLIESTNLQNMPKREVSDARFDVRSCFVPDEGYAFVEADLSGAEAWVTAACAGDTDLLERLRTPGFKVHSWTGSQIFGKPMAAVLKDSPEYVLGKMARHALNYGMQWMTFQRNVNADADKTGVSIDARTAKTICYGYHQLHPKLELWWERVRRQLDTTKRLTTCFGRTRHFFGRRAGEMLSETHREAIAFEPQSTVADLLNRGLLRWWDRHEGKVGQLLAQIHDAVLIQVPLGREELAKQLLRRCLEESITVHGITLTIPVDITVSAHWGAWKEAA